MKKTVLILALILASCAPQNTIKTNEIQGKTTITNSAVDSTGQHAPNITPQNCKQEIGEKAAKALVETCIAVSPATHPPCHVANSCQMIRNEISRSCDLIGDIDLCKKQL